MFLNICKLKGKFFRQNQVLKSETVPEVITVATVALWAPLTLSSDLDKS